LTKRDELNEFERREFLNFQAQEILKHLNTVYNLLNVNEPEFQELRLEAWNLRNKASFLYEYQEKDCKFCVYWLTDPDPCDGCEKFSLFKTEAQKAQEEVDMWYIEEEV